MSGLAPPVVTVENIINSCCNIRIYLKIENIEEHGVIFELKPVSIEEENIRRYLNKIKYSCALLTEPMTHSSEGVG